MLIELYTGKPICTICTWGHVFLRKDTSGLYYYCLSCGVMHKAEVVEGKMAEWKQNSERS